MCPPAMPSHSDCVCSEVQHRCSCGFSALSSHLPDPRSRGKQVTSSGKLPSIHLPAVPQAAEPEGWCRLVAYPASMYMQSVNQLPCKQASSGMSGSADESGMHQHIVDRNNQQHMTRSERVCFRKHFCAPLAPKCGRSVWCIVLQQEVAGKESEAAQACPCTKTGSNQL